MGSDATAATCRQSAPDAPRSPTPSLRWRDSSPFVEEPETPVPAARQHTLVQENLHVVADLDMSFLDLESAFTSPRAAPPLPKGRPFSANMDPCDPLTLWDGCGVALVKATASSECPSSFTFTNTPRHPPDGVLASRDSGVLGLSSLSYPPRVRLSHISAISTSPQVRSFQDSQHQHLTAHSYLTPAPPSPSKVYSYPAVASANSPPRSLISRQPYASPRLQPPAALTPWQALRRTYNAYSVFLRAGLSLAAVVALAVGFNYSQAQPSSSSMRTASNAPPDSCLHQSFSTSATVLYPLSLGVSVVLAAIHLTTAALHAYLFSALALPWDYLANPGSPNTQHSHSRETALFHLVSAKWIWWTWWAHRRSPFSAVVAIATLAFCFLTFVTSLSLASTATWLSLAAAILVLEPALSGILWFFNLPESWSILVSPPGLDNSLEKRRPTPRVAHNSPPLAVQPHFNPNPTGWPLPATYPIDPDTLHPSAWTYHDSDVAVLVETLHNGPIANFTMDGNVLVYFDGERRLVPPCELRGGLVRSAWYSTAVRASPARYVVAHSRAMEAALARFWWPGMNDDIETWVAEWWCRYSV